FTLPFGPYKVTRVKQPNTYKQQGINAWLLNNYGWLPESYVITGYATGPSDPFWADASMREQIAQQFSDPAAVVTFKVPYQGIGTTVRLVRLTDDTDSSTAAGETVYTLELDEADGQMTSRAPATSGAP
ncbi:MAG: hypothetical protein KGI71_04490, partial [Patescibacteria group bacterium]|nr:hypothetical protein [Patescibacteria group bacterium]